MHFIKNSFLVVSMVLLSMIGTPARASICNLILAKHDSLVSLLEKIKLSPELLNNLEATNHLFKKTLAIEVTNQDIAEYIRSDFSLLPYLPIAERLSPSPLKQKLSEIFREGRLLWGTEYGQQVFLDYLAVLRKLALRPSIDYLQVEVVTRDRLNEIPFNLVFAIEGNSDYGPTYRFLTSLHYGLQPFFENNNDPKAIFAEIRQAAQQELLWFNHPIPDYTHVVDLKQYLQLTSMLDSTRIIPVMILLYTPGDSRTELLLKAMDKVAFEYRGWVRFGKIDLSQSKLARLVQSDGPFEMKFYSRPSGNFLNMNPNGSVDQTPYVYFTQEHFEGLDPSNAHAVIHTIIQQYKK